MGRAPVIVREWVTGRNEHTRARDTRAVGSPQWSRIDTDSSPFHVELAMHRGGLAHARARAHARNTIARMMRQAGDRGWKKSDSSGGGCAFGRHLGGVDLFDSPASQKRTKDAAAPPIKRYDVRTWKNGPSSSCEKVKQTISRCVKTMLPGCI